MVFSYIAEGAFSMENCINKQHTCFCKQLFTPIKFSLSISSGTVGSISHPSYFDKIGTLVQPFFTSKEFARFFFDLNECLWACRGRPLSPRVSSRVDCVSCVTDNHHLPDYFVLIIIKFDDPGTWLQNRECISLLSAQLFFFFSLVQQSKSVSSSFSSVKFELCSRQVVQRVRCARKTFLKYFLNTLLFIV